MKGVTVMAVRYAEALLRRVEFRVSGRLVPEACRVCLAASFNQWHLGSHEMRRDHGGDWILTVALPPGVYPYLLYVDGTWYNDPHDDGRAPTGWGNDYSLKVVA